MENKKNKTKKFFIAEVIFIAGVLVYLFFSTAPNQIYPLSGMTVIEPNFVFEIENGESIEVSNDEDFTNPILLNEGSDITLSPGTYYWKVKSNLRKSEVKNFTIQGHVSLEIKEREENYELYNSGNVDLNVTKENRGLTAEIILDVGESEDVEKDNSTYKGVQK